MPDSSQQLPWIVFVHVSNSNAPAVGEVTAADASRYFLLSPSPCIIVENIHIPMAEINYSNTYMRLFPCPPTVVAVLDPNVCVVIYEASPEHCGGGGGGGSKSQRSPPPGHRQARLLPEMAAHYRSDRSAKHGFEDHSPLKIQSEMQHIVMCCNRRASLIARAQTYHEEVERSLESLKPTPLQRLEGRAGCYSTRTNITARNTANEVFVVETLHQEDVQRWGRAVRRDTSSHQPSASCLSEVTGVPLSEELLHHSLGTVFENRVENQTSSQPVVIERVAFKMAQPIVTTEWAGSPSFSPHSFVCFVLPTSHSCGSHVIWERRYNTAAIYPTHLVWYGRGTWSSSVAHNTACPSSSESRARNGVGGAEHVEEVVQAQLYDQRQADNLPYVWLFPTRPSLNYSPPYFTERKINYSSIYITRFHLQRSFVISASFARGDGPTLERFSGGWLEASKRRDTVDPSSSILAGLLRISRIVALGTRLVATDILEYKFTLHQEYVVGVINIWPVLNTEALRAGEGESRWLWGSAGKQGWRKLEITEKTRRPAASPGTIPTCDGNRTRFTFLGGELYKNIDSGTPGCRL
ncbi:hypothetical protein PR048_005591 [Dryococelus australis]|uniref:Uncharacterized protein n=1 Tax=Dryococelus australis TaxID=614101 RepID=A0ABQ9I8K9_9NEOP|nr:hypothetical protein PR048_005591 [Dryococelus australis]